MFKDILFKDMIPIEPKEVFLGGTCNGTTWREELISKLKINYFNPIVKDWNKQAQENELKKRETCDYLLYVITPNTKGLYSVAEVVDDSNKRPQKTIFCFLETDGKKYFDEGQKRSLRMVGKMVEANGGKWFTSLDQIARYLNSDK